MQGLTLVIGVSVGGGEGLVEGFGVGPGVSVELVDGFVGPGGGVEGAGVDEAEVDGVAQSANDDEEIRIGGVDGTGTLGDVLVPIARVVDDGPQFVAEVHTDDVGSAFGESSHDGETLEPLFNVEVFGVVAEKVETEPAAVVGIEPAVAVVCRAAPRSFRDMIVEDHFDVGAVERIQHSFVDIKHRRVRVYARVVLDYGIIKGRHIGWRDAREGRSRIERVRDQLISVKGKVD